MTDSAGQIVSAPKSATERTAQSATLRFSAGDGFRYGLLGFPLAFCALPLYVLLPNLYALEYGVALSTLGAILLGARLLDAAVDPLLGRWCDRLFSRSVNAVLVFGAVAACVLAVGFCLLFFPPTREPQALLQWATALLVLTYAAYSALAVAHQSWGAMLGGDELMRGRIVAWREGLGLVGVVLAATTPALLGLGAMAGLFLASLMAGLLVWSQARRPLPLAHTADTTPANTSLWRPWQVRDFRRLILVFLLNGVASAVPATLVLFFVQDRLQAPDAIQPLFLGAYFICGALSMPLWLMLVKHAGLAGSWLMGMLLAIAVFLWTMQLGAGDTPAFLLVCALSGVALGSDLALPGALLAGVIAKARDRGRAEGAYFGWWNFATKLNLALAAGVALPLLQWLGYSPGTREPAALQTLTLAYCLLPCLLKAVAALALYFLLIQPAQAAKTNHLAESPETP